MFPVLYAFQSLLKDHYELDPGTNAIYNTSIMLPWGCKLLYGMIFDTFPICGSRKKAWMIILCILLAVTSAMATFMEFSSPLTVCILLAISSASTAGMDVIVDALMVMQAKRDPENGSQELLSVGMML